jgi:hypothetical protein
MTEDGSIPPDLAALDRSLRGIRFRPRESLGVELEGRLRRGRQVKGAVSPRRIRRLIPGLAACAVIALGGWVAWTRSPVPIDRCCYDLDGGQYPDDGVLVLADRRERVHQVAIYEDMDGSRSYTEGDLIRFVRGAAPTLLAQAEASMITTRHCCIDFDGGGRSDDGLLVVGVPPDRVMMVALYDRSRDRTPSGYLLR